MKLLFVVDQDYLPQRTGGALVSTDSLCRRLASLGHPAAVLATLKRTGLVGFTNRFRRRIGVRIPQDNILGYPVYRERSRSSALREVLQDFAPDVVVVKSERDPVVAQIALDNGYPLILYLRDLEFEADGWRPPVGARMLVVANTTVAATSYEQRFGRRPRVIHSIVEAAEYAVQSERQVVTFINPIHKKGLDVALFLARARPDVPFEFVESWPLRREQGRQLQRELRGLRNVSFTRWRRRMQTVYGRSRAVLVPSQWIEAQARVVAEAHVSGIPALASDVGGLPESVGPGGILVGRTDLSGWEAALSTIWDDPVAYQRLAAAALAHSKRDTMNPEFIVSQFLRAVADCVGGRGHG